MTILHKSFELLETKADGDTGEFTALASVFGNVDHVGDRMIPGAFSKSLKKWRESGDPIPIVLSHQWNDVMAHIGVADPNEVRETARGLMVKGKLDIADNPIAKQTYKLLKRRSLKAFSFGYTVPPGGEEIADDGANDVKEVELVEVGPTLKGVNEQAQLQAVKSLVESVADGGEDVNEDEVRRLVNAVFKSDEKKPADAEELRRRTFDVALAGKDVPKRAEGSDRQEGALVGVDESELASLKGEVADLKKLFEDKLLELRPPETPPESILRRRSFEAALERARDKGDTNVTPIEKQVNELTLLVGNLSERLEDALGGLDAAKSAVAGEARAQSEAVESEVRKMRDYVRELGGSVRDLLKADAGDGGDTEEVTDELDAKAVWSTAYVNSLPDSAFLYVEPGGEKDGEGKTVPRTLRHFPVRDANGKVDPAHVRNALARIPQSNLPQSVKDRATAAARRLLDRTSSIDPASTGASNDEPSTAKSHARDSLRRRAFDLALEISSGGLDARERSEEPPPDDDTPDVGALRKRTYAERLSIMTGEKESL